MEQTWDEGAGETLYQSVFEADKKQTKGNQIAGTIQVKEDGYFITTIPYDKNFDITVDGKKDQGQEGQYGISRISHKRRTPSG